MRSLNGSSKYLYLSQKFSSLQVEADLGNRASLYLLEAFKVRDSMEWTNQVKGVKFLQHNRNSKILSIKDLNL